MEQQNGDFLPDHKLCGFILVVLSSSDPPSHLSPGTPCRPYSFSGSVRGFLTQSGNVLLPISEENADESSPDLKPKRKRGKRSRIQMLTGSVMDQIHTLLANHCLEVRGRVQRVSVRKDGKVRVVVMVDVYLPMGVWSSWQFPKSYALAASLFKHVSCDWETRTNMLGIHKDEGNSHNEDDRCIWYNSDCHVLGCSFHCSESDSNKQKLFDIHEIFKSLPTAANEEIVHYTSIMSDNATDNTGIWSIGDDVLTTILSTLSLRSLSCVSSTCKHLRSLALSVMPCMKLKLFPHQQAAVDWMLKRERHPTVLPHPHYMKFTTRDGCDYYINSVSGKISTGVVPTINDFCGGMFCDEPGLGKTITALSLILKTHGTVADPPHGVDVTWCAHNQVQRCGYYDLNYDKITDVNLMSKWKRSLYRRGQYVLNKMAAGLDLSRTSKSSSLKRPFDSVDNEIDPFGKNEELSYASSDRLPQTGVLRSNGRLGHARRNLLDELERSIVPCSKKSRKKSNSMKQNSSKWPEISNAGVTDSWVQCDSCRKWRRLRGKDIPDATAAWFCSMNIDQLHQSCAIPEELWDRKAMITYLPGFYSKGATSGNNKNTLFFVSILREHFTQLNRDTNKSLNWLAGLSYEKFEEMETNGLSLPVIGICHVAGVEARGYEIIFQAFGLVRKFKRGRIIWCYPPKLENLAFDSNALQIALTKSFDSFRFFLSRATLIIVPANLVEHWKSQIQKHIVPGLLRIFVWTDNKRPSAHCLAWDYDIVITTFNRLSAEWTPRKISVLMEIHWLRVILDEGHTLGSSLSLTNKLQMAISLIASKRWILTGTPTPNTPSSQLTHLQPMLKFLHEEVYGQDQESWDAGILKPFEAEIEEARSHLLQLLKRIMISARKKDLKNIPPCIKNVTLVDFNEEHARSYNELVVTVRRNILMADWNDPSHVESLLNPKQWKFRSNTIRNIRLSCCVAGHIKVTEAGNDIQDTMDVLVQQGLDPLSEHYGLIRVSLLYGGNCFRCKDWCRLPVITPCKHLLCLGCVALDSERCTLSGCRESYEMQFPETLKRPENPNPKWPVPKDLIELQPSYRQDIWDPDWQSTSSSKVSYLVQRLKSLQEANRKLDCHENVNDCKEVSTFDKRHCDFVAEGACRKQNGISCMTKPDKAIIFSQFLEHIHVIEQQLRIAGIEYVGMYSPMHSSNKMKSLMTFQQDINCMALLMDGSAALGLDLSFTTHVFLMEPIWDRSMEEQVISRAHRMGATRPIHVETLAMRGTIEEQMMQFLEDSTECIKAFKQDVRGTEYEGTRVHRTLHDFAESNYLAKVGFVKTNNAIA